MVTQPICVLGRAPREDFVQLVYTHNLFRVFNGRSVVNQVSVDYTVALNEPAQTAQLRNLPNFHGGHVSNKLYVPSHVHLEKTLFSLRIHTICSKSLMVVLWKTKYQSTIQWHRTNLLRLRNCEINQVFIEVQYQTNLVLTI